ncbi:MAG: FAD:protein FMN transferase [Planctomycetales bacterium]|nr:FAD:protein FMN transferase [Planctomycetales bacterium]
MSPESSRREFLTGRSALRALADAHEKLAVPLPVPAGEAQTWLTQISREAMACEFEILLDAKKYPAGPDAAVEALDLVEALEGQLTIYRDTSEVSRLNQRAFEQPVVVEDLLFELFVQARELWKGTGGAFDVTSGALTKIWGFYRRQGRMPSEAEVAEALAKVGSQHLELDASTKTVRFLLPGLEINLGAIGKGHTLDRCAELLVSRGIDDFVIHGGNSSVLARGSRGESGKRKTESGEGSSQTEIPNLKSQISNPESSPSPSPQPPSPSPPLPWSIGLRHPLRPNERLAEFVLQDQALGTSGSGSQFFHHQGKRYGHILDPRTGWPAEKVLSATVIAPTAAEADALSTAFYVLGIDGASDYCEQHPNISALLVTQKGVSVELHPVNLPDERWRVV